MDELLVVSTLAPSTFVLSSLTSISSDNMGAVREAVGVGSDTMGPMGVAGLLVIVKVGGEGAEEGAGGGEGSFFGTSLTKEHQ